jgi:hypothetical protein
MGGFALVGESLLWTCILRYLRLEGVHGFLIIIEDPEEFVSYGGCEAETPAKSASEDAPLPNDPFNSRTADIERSLAMSPSDLLAEGGKLKGI